MKLSQRNCFLSITGILAGAVFSLNVFSQAVLNPNQITGTIEFTNNNQTILDILDTQGFDYAFMTAHSIGVSPQLNNYSFPPAQTPTSMSYEMTVEASDVGIPYKVYAQMWMDNRGDKYLFGLINSAPVVSEPAADVNVSYQQCAGMLDIKFQNGDGSPRAVSGGNIVAYRETTSSYGTYFAVQAQDFAIPNGHSQAYLAVHGDGSLYRVDAHYASGADPYSDMVSTLCRHEVLVACDEVVELICKTSGTTELGQIAGNINMEGEAEHDVGHLTRLWAHNGPFKNYRYDKVPGEGSYLLENLVPSDAESPPRDYWLYGEMAFRTGYRMEYFRTPRLDGYRNDSVYVEAGKTTDLGDTFVFDPGYVKGNILLAGPPNSDSGAYLADLYRDADSDYDNNGLPDSLILSSSAVQAQGSDVKASGATMGAWGGIARVGFVGSYNDATGSFEGDYEMVLGGLLRESSIWKPSDLILKFIDTATPEVMGSYQYSRQQITNLGITNTEIVPGQTTNIDHAYCMSELKLAYKSLAGVFYNPKARAIGSFDGTDFQGNPAQYSIRLDYANGLPRTSQTAASEGLVVMTLAEGSYEFTPTVTAVNPTGGTTNTELPPVSMDVGCRQAITSTTELQINMDTLPAVSDGETVTVAGTINSNRNITKISYSHNRAAEVELCNDCGINPSFSTEVTLVAGDNEIRVDAVDELGDVASVTSTINHSPAVVVEPLVIAGCSDQKKMVEYYETGTTVSYDITASGGCDAAPVARCNIASGSYFSLGSTAVSCSTVDSCGSQAQCGFSVTVEAKADPNASDGGTQEPVVEDPLETDVLSPDQELVDAEPVDIEPETVVLSDEAEGSEDDGDSDKFAPDTKGKKSRPKQHGKQHEKEDDRVNRPINKFSDDDDVADKQKSAPAKGLKSAPAKDLKSALKHRSKRHETEDGRPVNKSRDAVNKQSRALDVVPVFSTKRTQKAGNNEIPVSEIDEQVDEVKEEPEACDSSTQKLKIAHSLGTNVLWPPNHELMGVGLGTKVTEGCDQVRSNSLTTVVWSDETEVPASGDGNGKFAPDAKGMDSALRLRSERRGTEDGRVYLLISKVTDYAGKTAFTCSTVVVPHDKSKSSLKAVNAQAAAALSFCEANNGTPPPGFTQHGISKEIGPKQ